MAVTLPEYAKGLVDLKAQAVVEQFAMASDILGAIPFKTAPGGAYRYLQEEDMGNIAFRALNEVTTESHGVISLFILNRRSALKSFARSRSQMDVYTSMTSSRSCMKRRIIRIITGEKRFRSSA